MRQRFSFGYHASAQGSVGLTVGTRGSVGVTATLGGGFSATAGGPPEASITRGVQITNARCVADLGGLFYDVGGSGGLDYAGSADYFAGKGAVTHGPVAGGTVEPAMVPVSKFTPGRRRLAPNLSGEAANERLATA